MEEGILDRIAQLANNERITITHLENKIGASKGVLSRAIAKKTDIQAKWLQLIVDNFQQYNANWLLTGEGEMLRGGDKLLSNNAKAVINYNREGNPYYNVDFTGGFDLLINDQTVNPDYYINFEPLNIKDAVWCNVSGHSMEPEITSGDKIIIKEVKNWRSFLPFGEIYGIITDEFRTIKRIRKSKIPDQWLMVPSNPEYDQQELPINKVIAVYQVLGTVKMF